MRTNSEARRFHDHDSHGEEHAFNQQIRDSYAGIMALGVSSASAAVVCNEEGDCWRVKERRAYEPSLKLRVYPDDWRWKEGERYRWREHGRGHGYWRNGVWIEIN